MCVSGIVGMTWYMSADDVSLCFKETAIYVSIMIKFLSNFSVVLIYQTSLASFCQRKNSNNSSSLPPLTLKAGGICSDKFCWQILQMWVYDYSGHFTRATFDSQPWNWDWRFYPQELWKLIFIGKTSYANRFWVVESRVYFLTWSWIMPNFNPHSSCLSFIHFVPLMFFLRPHSLLDSLSLFYQEKWDAQEESIQAGEVTSLGLHEASHMQTSCVSQVLGWIFGKYTVPYQLTNKDKNFQ